MFSVMKTNSIAVYLRIYKNTILPLSRSTSSKLIYTEENNKHIQSDLMGMYGEADKPQIQHFIFNEMKNFVYLRKWITFEQVDKMLKFVEDNGILSKIQALFLLECCGTLSIFENNEARQDMTNKAWQIIKNSGINLDLRQFNRLLQTVNENDGGIDISVLLQEISDAGLHPDDITNEKLISFFSQIGNMKEVDKILKIFDESGLQITEEICNNVMIGHARGKNIGEALRIINNMKLEGINYGIKTYETLLKIYAEMNKEKEVVTLFSNLSDVSISPETLIKAHFQFLRNKNNDAADMIYSHLPNSLPTNMVAPAVVNLLQINEYEMAFKYVKLGINLSTNYKYTYFPKLLFRHAPFDILIDLCERMTLQGINASAFSISLKASLDMGNSETSLKILHEMKKRNVPIKDHYLFPLICLATKNGSSDLSELCNILQFGSNRCVYIYYLWVFPLIDTTHPMQTFKKLDENLSFTHNYMPTGLLLYLVKHNRIKEAEEFISKLTFKIPPYPDIFGTICLGYIHNPEHFASFGKIIAYGVGYKNRHNNKNALKSFLIALHHFHIRLPDKNERIFKLLENLIENNIGLAEIEVDDLTERYADMDEQVRNCIRRITNMELISPPIETMFKVKNLCSQMDRVHEYENESNSTPISKLKLESVLHYYSQNKHFQQADATYKKIQIMNSDLSENTYYKMTNLYYYDKDYHSVVSVLFDLLKHIPHPNISPTMVVKYVRSLVELGKLEDATKLVRNQENLSKHCDNRSRNALVFRSVADLFNRLSNLPNEKGAHSLTQALLNKEYCSHSMMYRESIMNYLYRNDLNAAIKTFVEAYKITGNILCEQLLVNKCIQNITPGEKNRLPFVLQFLGRNRNFNFANNIAFWGHIEYNNLEEAKKICQNTDFELDKKILQQRINILNQKNSLHILDRMLSVMEEKPFHNIKLLYEDLIYNLNRNKKTDKLNEFINKLQDQKRK